MHDVTFYTCTYFAHAAKRKLQNIKGISKAKVANLKERAKAIIPIEFETTQNSAGGGNTRSSSGTLEEDGRPLPTEDDDEEEEENSIPYHPIDMLLDFGIAANDIEKLKVGGYHTIEVVRNQVMQRRNRTFRRQSIINFKLYIVWVSL